MGIKDKIPQRFKDSIKRLVGRPTRSALFSDFIPHGLVGAELGVFKGEFSYEILRFNQPRELVLIDVWWTLFGDTYPNWGAYTNNGTLKTRKAYELTCNVTKLFPKTKTSIMVGDDRELLLQFPNRYFDWVYIDSSHEYKHTWEELEILEFKVKEDGYICGHDWIADPNNLHYGVYKAVNEFCQQKNYAVVFTDDFTQWVIRRRDFLKTDVGTLP